MFASKFFRKWEYGLDRKVEWYLWHHPILGLLGMLFGIPLFVLICVCLCTVLIAFPVTWLLG